jgi:hypothetical protein
VLNLAEQQKAKVEPFLFLQKDKVFVFLFNLA